MERGIKGDSKRRDREKEGKGRKNRVSERVNEFVRE